MREEAGGGGGGRGGREESGEGLGWCQDAMPGEGGNW